MGRLLVYLGRLILIVIGFLCAALAASAAMHLLILPALGFDRGEAAAVAGGAVVFSIPFVALFVAYFALTPSLVVIAIAELWSVRSWLYHALGGGAVGLALAALFGSNAPRAWLEQGLDVQPVQPSGSPFDLSLLAVLIGAGMVGGLVYWLVAGSTSGSWKRVAQTMRLAIVTLAYLGLGTASALAGEQKFPAMDNGQVVFGTPSGNVACLFTPKGGAGELSCYRNLPTSLSFFLRVTGKAQRYDFEGDVPGPSAALRYGNTWSKAGFTCKSSQSGLTCTRGKNGFFISKKKTSVY